LRRTNIDLNDIKAKINELKGRNIKMEVNRGRRRIVCYEGIIEDTYASVFIVRLFGTNSTDKLSYSYTDVLCGDVKIGIKN